MTETRKAPLFIHHDSGQLYHGVWKIPAIRLGGRVIVMTDDGDIQPFDMPSDPTGALASILDDDWGVRTGRITRFEIDEETHAFTIELDFSGQEEIEE